MNGGLSFSFFWSKAFLTSRAMLWAMFWVNALGTIYGYEWYLAQLVHTATKQSAWLLPFVPDSPTASLFFTFSLVYLMLDPMRTASDLNLDADKMKPPLLRSLIEALAIITSVKYGIWAAAMNFASAWQGVPLQWQNWMLIFSHGGMAVEALLFARFFRLRALTLVLAAGWTFTNDYLDYHQNVFPWLAEVLYDDLPFIEKFTIALSLLGIACALVFGKFHRRRKV